MQVTKKMWFTLIIALNRSSKAQQLDIGDPHYFPGVLNNEAERHDKGEEQHNQSCEYYYNSLSKTRPYQAHRLLEAAQGVLSDPLMKNLLIAKTLT